MASHKEIPFEFPVNGCFERADEMTRLMLLKGIKPLKGFLSVDPEKGIYLEFPDKNDPEKPWQWHDHVAPIVMVQEKGKVVPYAIDPSTEKKAVPLEKWRNNLSSHNKKIKVTTEIGRTGQYKAGSPMDFDFDDRDSLQRLKASIQELKVYEQSRTGFQDYQGDVMMNYDDNDGKIDAMSEGN